MIQLKKMNKFKKYKIILQQDDCAPDSREIFDREFIEYLGVPLEFFTNSRVPIDNGDTFIYLYGDYRIINETNIWRVEQLQN